MLMLVAVMTSPTGFEFYGLSVQIRSRLDAVDSVKSAVGSELVSSPFVNKEYEQGARLVVSDKLTPAYMYKGTPMAPITLGHKVNMSHEPEVSPAPSL